MKTKNIFLTLALALSTTFAFAQITTSAHNFAASAWNTTGEICITCHTPHGTNAATIGAPLWSHDQSVAVITPYSNTASLTATVGAPTGTSKLCLSCHDGTVDLSAFVGETGAAATRVTAGAGLLGTDLSTHHPVSFTYDAQLVIDDGGLVAFDNVDVAALLIGTEVECASCHDPHNAGFTGLLRKSNAASALCLTCHAK